MYLRYETTEPGPSGRHTGIFGLANGLASRGELAPDDLVWLRANNHWLDEAFADPGLIDPTLFDKRIHPMATCWFKLNEAFGPLLARVAGHLALLDRYGVAWRERRTATVGRILYEDPVQIISDGQPG